MGKCAWFRNKRICRSVCGLLASLHREHIRVMRPLIANKAYITGQPAAMTSHSVTPQSESHDASLGLGYYVNKCAALQFCKDHLQCRDRTWYWWRWWQQVAKVIWRWPHRTQSTPSPWGDRDPHLIQCSSFVFLICNGKCEYAATCKMVLTRLTTVCYELFLTIYQFWLCQHGFIIPPSFFTM